MAATGKGKDDQAHDDVAQSMVCDVEPRFMRWLHTQDEAIRESEAHPNYFIFAKDKVPSRVLNAKKYAACTLPRMFNYIAAMDRAHRNVYEVLRPGIPSKLYLDCDVKLHREPDFNPQWFISVLEQDLRTFLAAEVHPDFDDASVTELIVYDSSTKIKWSQHLLIDGAMFLNNFHVGAIMRRFRDYVVKKYGNPDEPDVKNPYFITPKDPELSTDGYYRDFIIDLTVYTRYRVFRLPGNCKHGRTAFLVPARADISLEKTTRKQKEFILDLDELRRGIIQDPVLALKCKIHSVKERDGSVPDSYSVHRRNRFASVPHRDPRQTYVLSNNLDFHHGSNSLSSLRKTACSPQLLALLANMIEDQHNQQIVGRSSRYYPETLTVSLPSRGRYCAVRKDNHSSSKTYYNVQLDALTYSQRCFSSRCISVVQHEGRGRLEWPNWAIPPSYHSGIDRFLNATNSTLHKSNLSVSKISTLLSGFVQSTPRVLLEECDPWRWSRAIIENLSEDEDEEMVQE